MVNLSTHYKERAPMDTVQIITDFFEKNGFKLTISDVTQSEAGTWYCHVTVSIADDGIYIGGANGKGMTKEYALASGHAELYERFCNHFFATNPYWTRSLIDENQKYGYNFRPNEKILSIEEQFAQSDNIKKHFNYFTNDDKVIERIINYITNNKIIGVPFNCIDEQSTIYLDPRIALYMNRSVGMVAGNTKVEALIQGISELIEKEAFHHAFIDPNIKLNALNLDNIEDKHLQEVIQNIKHAGYTLYLFDLSYTGSIPAVMSVIVDRENGLTNFNIGSFPVFEIAAERSLTELYQGINSFKNEHYLTQVREPYKLFDQPFYMLSKNGNSYEGSCFSLDLLKNAVYQSTYNKEVYLKKECTNEECLDYYIELSKKLNIKFYYIDNSLSKDIAALHIIAFGDKSFTGFEGMNIGLYDNLMIGATFKLMSLYETVFDGIYNNNLDIFVLLELFNSINQLVNTIGMDNKNMLFLWNYVSIVCTKVAEFFEFLQIIQFNGNINSITDNILNTPFYKAYKKYYLLQIYVGTYKYTTDECLTIFNEYFNFNITNEDIENIFNQAYLVKKVYIEPLVNYIHSENYHKIIKLFSDSLRY